MNGSDLKRLALDTLEAKRADTILQARRAFLEHALAYGTVTADDVQTAVELPTGVDPKVLGPVPVPFARAGIVTRVGFRNSTRAESHARPVSVWELLDAEAATDWLRANPAPAEWIADSGSACAETPTAQGTLFGLGNMPATAEGW